MISAKKSYIDQVHEIVRMIPVGRVSSYGAIADYLALGSARMVGFALKSSIMQDDIPAHRVVNGTGQLSGRMAFPTPTYMQEMLEYEGVEIKNFRVVNFKKKLWHPAEGF